MTCFRGVRNERVDHRGAVNMLNSVHARHKTHQCVELEEIVLDGRARQEEARAGRGRRQGRQRLGVIPRLQTMRLIAHEEPHLLAGIEGSRVDAVAGCMGRFGGFEIRVDWALQWES